MISPCGVLDHSWHRIGAKGENGEVLWGPPTCSVCSMVSLLADPPKRHPLITEAFRKYQLLSEPLAATARSLGYALAFHGSIARDIDFLACPWTEQAVAPRLLAEAIRVKAAEVNGGLCFTDPRTDDEYHKDGCPGLKPHGRLCWVFYLGGPVYIDLSVMPKHDVIYPVYKDAEAKS